MKPEDKKRLQDAFRTAVERSPRADQVINEFFVDPDGNPLTHRKGMELALASKEFYEEVDRSIKAGEMTLDKYIAAINKSYPAPKP